MNRCVQTLLCWLLALGGLSAQAQTTDAVSMGFYQGANRDISLTDMRAAFSLWSKELAAAFQTKFDVKFYDDMADMRRAFDRGEINAVSASGLNLARHFQPAELADGYSVAMPGGWNVLLMSGKANPVRSLADLKDKRIAIADNDGLLDIYLETLCMGQHQLPCGRVAAEVQRVANSNQALMRLYFGKADVALVYRYGYELSRDLNPQLDAKLGRIVSELPLAGGVFFSFFSNKVAPSYRQRVLALVPSLHTYPRGRQLLDMLKMDHLEVVSPQALHSFAQVDQTYREQKAEIDKKGKGP